MSNSISSRFEMVKSPQLTLGPAELVTVAALRHPFRSERVLTQSPPGKSVADMMRAAGIHPGAEARVFLGDRLILPEERGRVYPKPGQTLAIRLAPAGGGRGKDVEILTIVVAAIATVATYGATSALIANTAFFASATQAGGSNLLASAALAGIQGAINESVKFLGGLAINALIPPPSTPAPRAVSTPQSYTVSGTANGAAPFSPVPEIYGDAQNCFYEPRARPDSRCIVAAAIGRASILQHPSEGGRLSVSVDGVFLRVYPRNACRQFFTSGRRAFGRKLNSWIPVARDGPLPQRETISGAGRLTHATPRHQAIRPLPLQSSLRDGSTSRERDKRCYGDESTYLNSHA